MEKEILKINQNKGPAAILLGLLIAFSFAVAYNSFNPETFGHSANEIAVIPANAPGVFPFNHTPTGLVGSITVSNLSMRSQDQQGIIKTGEPYVLWPGTINRSVEIPLEAKEVLININEYSLSADSSLFYPTTIRFKQPSKTYWFDQSYMNQYSQTIPSNRLIWLPLDSNGELEWEIVHNNVSGPAYVNVTLLIYKYRV